MNMPSNKTFHWLSCSAIAVLLCIMLGGCEKTDPTKAAVQASIGVNSQIVGSYDKTLAAACSNGTFVGQRDGSVLAYKGIPYAEAPVGELRWRDPVPVSDGDGIYEALYFGKSPIQTEWPSEPGSYYLQGEDCLTLNVWTSDAEATAGKPVMVFFHGGSYGWGATSDPMYDGRNLVEKYPDIVLVTVEYRQGLLGFIDFSTVSGGEAYATSGNLGLLDQVCALRWLQVNAAAFGGDSDNVTIWGESAGAGSVLLLPLMEGTEGLFRRIIAESGSVALTYSREECENLTRMLLEESGCTDMAGLLALSEAELMELNKGLNDYNNFPERDGVVLPMDPYAAWADGVFADIDLLIGTNADEVRYWINEMGYTVPVLPGLLSYKLALPVLYENNLARLASEDREAVEEFLAFQQGQEVWKLTEFYNELLFRVPAMEQAVAHSDAGGRSYVYYWTMPGADATTGACHAVELSYVFNNPQATIYTGGLYDADLADTVQDLWVSFARGGVPEADGAPAWEPYARQVRQTMVLGESVRMAANLKPEQRKLLQPLLGYYFNGCYMQMSLNVPYVWRMVGLLAGAVALLGCCLWAAVHMRRKRR